MEGHAMSRQIVRTEIVSDDVTLFTMRVDEENISSVSYEFVCDVCNIVSEFDNRPDALSAGREHECEFDG
jgi:hypothetical protein